MRATRTWCAGNRDSRPPGFAGSREKGSRRRRWAIILNGPHFHVSYQGINTHPRKGKAYFALEFEPGENDAGWLCVAGIATGGRTPERVQASTYALDVVKGYFLSRGREMRMGDPAAVLERMLDYINAKLHQQSRSKGREFLTDLNLFACTKDRLCVVGTGGATVFVSHQGAAKKVMGHDSPLDLLGQGEALRLPRLDSPVWAGDQIVFLSPPLGEVFGSREVSLILQKVSDPDKTTVLFNTLAARKEVEGELVTLIWEVPLTEERKPFREAAAARVEPAGAETVQAGTSTTGKVEAEPLDAGSFVTQVVDADALDPESYMTRAVRAPAAPSPADIGPMEAGPPDAWSFVTQGMDAEPLDAESYAVEVVEPEPPQPEPAAAEAEEAPAEDEATTVKKSWLKRFGRNRIDLSP